MKKPYFKRMNEISDNRLWINNPTPREADLAIEAGAIACTTNPTYSYKQLTNPETQAEVKGVIKKQAKQDHSVQMAADAVQQKLVAGLVEKFYSLYQQNPGKQGFVSIQGNPFRDHAAENIIEEARRYRKIGKNIIVKIPVTKAGLQAIGVLIEEDVPILATEVMSLSQAITVNDLYKRVSKRSGHTPPIFITHITGIFDQYLHEYVAEHQIDIQPDILWAAGCMVARKQYHVLKEQGIVGTMLSGGARGLHHLTEMIGSDLHITVNWKGTAETLIEQDPPIAYRMDTPSPQFMIDKLREKLPAFNAAWTEDGMTIEEFEAFGPVQLFRSMFCNGWSNLEEAIKQTRAEL